MKAHLKLQLKPLEKIELDEMEKRIEALNSYPEPENLIIYGDRIEKSQLNQIFCKYGCVNPNNLLKKLET
jgi:hypothetical protein